MKELIKQLESKVKNCHNTNTIFDTRNYVLLDDVRKIIAAINYTHCCKSDSELLVCDHKVRTADGMVVTFRNTCEICGKNMRAK